jgi:hypothetical protein
MLLLILLGAKVIISKNDAKIVQWPVKGSVQKWVEMKQIVARPPCITYP